MFKYFGDSNFGQGVFFHDGLEKYLDRKIYRVGVMTRSIFTDPYHKFTMGELMTIKFGIFSRELENIRVGFEDETDDMHYHQEADSPQGTLSAPLESLTYYPAKYMCRNAFKIMFVCDCPKDGDFLLERIDLQIAARRNRSATLAEAE